MIRICCSNHHVGDRVFGEKEPLDDKNETHGYCDPCFELEEIEIQIALKKLRDAGWTPFRGTQTAT
jgi:hypothetical protein